MARYIDADSLYSRVKTHTNPYGKPTLDYKSGVKVLEMINQAPTADVVPRAEVEKIIHTLEQKRVNDIENAAKIGYRAAKQEVAREIFMDIDRVVEKYSMGDIEYPAFVDTIAKFKKKYTEATNG